jgi:hypothetical protein
MSNITSPLGFMTRDGRGDTVELLSVRNWRPATIFLSAGQWTLLGDGAPRGAILIKAPITNGSNVILSHSTLSAVTSNDPTSVLCGMPLSPGENVPLSFTENLAVYGRIVAGGSAGKVHVAEAL